MDVEVRMDSGQKRIAFSLIEIFVVVAIIVTLCGISVPVVIRQRHCAYATLCKANLKAIGNAFISYQSAYNGWMPHALDNNVEQTDDGGRAIGWKYELSFYLGNHGAAQHEARSYPLHKAFVDPVQGAGKGNYFLSAAQFGERLEVKNPQGSWIPYFTYAADGTARDEPAGYMPSFLWRSPETAAIVTDSCSSTIHRGFARDRKTGKINVDYRHAGLANVLFLDCHVAEFGKGDEQLFRLFDKKVLEPTGNIRQLPSPP